MERNYIISVAMATYNGEKYIKEQLDSILKQLNANDEVIISDDGSTDNTLEIINSYNDSRIKVFDGPHKGVKQNFANAINYCTGKYIFLSDQDDVWMDNKVEKVLETMEEGYNCVLHDAVVMDSNLSEIIYNSFFKFRNTSTGIVRNMIKNSYIGCCMCFDKKIKDKLSIIPDSVNMHDQWIGLLSERVGKVFLLNEKLIKYRRHDMNVSKMTRDKIPVMITKRIKLFYNYVTNGFGLTHYLSALYWRTKIIISNLVNKKVIHKIGGLKNISDSVINMSSGGSVYKKNEIVYKGFDIFGLYKNEYRILDLLKEHNISPTPYKLYKKYFTEEFLKGETLDLYIQNNKKDVIPFVFDELINIMKVLKDNHIQYNDIRPENFIVSNNKIYIIDFGCSVIANDKFKLPNRIRRAVGTIYYNGRHDDVEAVRNMLVHLNVDYNNYKDYYIKLNSIR